MRRARTRTTNRFALLKFACSLNGAKPFLEAIAAMDKSTWRISVFTPNKFLTTPLNETAASDVPEFVVLSACACAVVRRLCFVA